MTRPALFVTAFLAIAGPVSGQQGFVRASSQRFTFADPAGVGLRSYAMTATTAGVSLSVLPWLAAGTTLGHARASMTSRGVSTDVSGMTDLQAFLVARTGPLRFRGEYLLPSGSPSMSWGENVVAGVAAHDLFPFAVRSWGRGGGYALEVSVPFGLPGFDMEVLAATRDHGTISPFDDDTFTYDFGAERRVAVRVGRDMNALTRVDVGVVAVFPTPDHAAQRDVSRREVEVFDPGRRLDLYSVASFVVGRTSVLARGDLYGRHTGLQSPEAGAALSGMVGGSVTARTRRLAAVGVETRSPMRFAPVLTTTRLAAMQGTDGAGSSWLATMGIGSELELRGPWPGRSFVTPMLTIHRGSVGVADGYESVVGAWEVSLGARWEAGR